MCGPWHSCRVKLRKPRLWITVGAVLWAVFLVGAGTWAARNGEPTVREQTTIVEALPTVDRAVAAMVAAAAGPRAVVGVGGYERTESACDAGNRTGERYHRVATVYVTPGTEGEMIDRVGGGLPRDWDAVVRHSGGVHALRADAGFYVRLTGSVAEPGELRFTADTGCRMRGGTLPRPPAAGSPPSAADVLARLGVAGGGQASFAVRCASRSDLSAITVSAPRPSGPLAGALPSGVEPILKRENLLVFTSGGVGYAVRLRAEDVQVTAASGCQ
jgi:hypothetical protein